MCSGKEVFPAALIGLALFSSIYGNAIGKNNWHCEKLHPWWKQASICLILSLPYTRKIGKQHTDQPARTDGNRHRENHIADAEEKVFFNVVKTSEQFDKYNQKKQCASGNINVKYQIRYVNFGRNSRHAYNGNDRRSDGLGYVMGKGVDSAGNPMELRFQIRYKR